MNVTERELIKGQFEKETSQPAIIEINFQKFNKDNIANPDYVEWLELKLNFEN